MPPKGEAKNDKKPTETAKGKSGKVDEKPKNEKPTTSSKAKQVKEDDDSTQISITERLLRRYRHWKLYSTWDFRRVWQCLCCLSAPKRRRRKYGIPAEEVNVVEENGPTSVVDQVVPNEAPMGDSEQRASIFKSMRKQSTDDDSSLREKMDNLDQEQLDMLQFYAASKIQSIIRLFLSKFIVREAWNDAVDEGTDYWDYYQEHSDNTVMVKFRKRRAGIYVKNHFSRKYVSDILVTGVNHMLRRHAATSIQAVWRGYRVRLKYLSYRKKHPRFKKVLVKSRISDSSYRQIWSRTLFEPLADGWPVKPSALEYDMMQHKDKPPAGNEYGVRTYKVILAPRNEREKNVLLRDTNSWVGLPIYVQSSREYKVDSDPHKNSLYKKSLSYRSAYTVPVVNLPPPKKPPPLKGDKALVAMGWNKPEKNQDKKSVADGYKKPQALYKLTIEQGSNSDSTTSPSRPVTSTSLYSNNPSTPSITGGHAPALPELPSIFNDSFKEDFQSYDETVIHLETEMAAKGDTSKQQADKYEPELSRSYLMAIRKEIAALNEQRFGYKGSVQQKIRVVTPLRGGQKYISSLHQKAFEYSRKYGAFALPPTLEETASEEIEKYKDDFGVNLGNVKVKELLFDKYRDYTSSQYGGLSTHDTVEEATTKESKISVLKQSSWGSVKSRVENTPLNEVSAAADGGLQSRSLLRLRPVVEGKVRVWPIKKKKHYKLRYTWIPQKMVHKAVNIAYNDEIADDSSFFTSLDSGSVFTFTTKHTNTNILSTSLQDKSFDSYIDSVRYNKVAIEEKGSNNKLNDNNTAVEEEKINKKSKPSASVQLNHPYPWA